MSRKLTKYLSQYFEEDLVYKTTPGGSLQVGAVLESNENDDSDSDDDEEETSPSTRSKLQPGYAKVAWYPKGSPNIVRESKVKLFDRSLLTGDVVKRSDVTGGQRGLVVNSKVDLVCKIIGTNQVIVGQNKHYVHGVDLDHDVLFYYRNWIGSIEDINCSLILSLPDGSLIEMEESRILGLKDLTSERSGNDQFDNSDSPYVGQQVVLTRYDMNGPQGFKFVHKSENFDLGSFLKFDKLVLTVLQIKVEKVQAHWLCCISADIPSLQNFVPEDILHLKQPDTKITGDDLKEIITIDFFKTGNTEMGDRGVYVLKESDQVMSFGDWALKAANELRDHKLGLHSSITESTGCDDDDNYVDVSSDEQEDESILSLMDGMRFKKKLGVSIQRIRRKRVKSSKKINFPKKVYNFEIGSYLPVEVIATKTYVDVMWQDGLIEMDCPSTALYPIHHLDGHEYFPGDFVVKSNHEFNHNLYGVIQNVDHTERTARVRWLEVNPNQQPQFVSEQEVSVYDLEDHPDFVLRPGSVVARLPNTRTEKLKPSQRAGQVVMIKTSGHVECVWADGSRCEVDPQELYLIGDYDSDGLWNDEDDEDEDDSSDGFPSRVRTPTSATKLPSTNSTPKFTGSNRELIDRLRKSVDGLEEWLTQCPTLNTKNGHIAVKKLTSLLENLEAVDSRMNTSLTALKDLKTLIESTRLPESLSGHSAHINRKLSKLIQSLLKSTSGSRTPDQEELDEMICDGESTNEVAAASSPISTKTKHSLEILQKLKTQLFTVCPQNESSGMSEEKMEEQSSILSASFQQDESVPDSHKFKLSLMQVSNARIFSTRVKKEIDLLRSSLPKDIVVKGFENRMDLFSVLIKGPTGTPYEDGLFLFDVQLPAGYPNVPPLVHYIPFCRDRLNPNLYESGKVCVSLLGTWSGKGSEVWTPASSTLLQLFISIQGLILVPEPYYNEAGYTRQKGTCSGDENSRLYNEMAVVKVVESMTRMTQSPPEPFRDQIISHVKSTSSSFIARLESWIEVSSNASRGEGARDNNVITNVDFPLLPASKGFCLSLTSALQSYRCVLAKLDN